MQLTLSQFLRCTLVLLWGVCTLGAQARELQIGVGNFPPYFDAQGNTGLFNELIKETFALMPQHQVKRMRPMSNYRLVAELNNGRVDGSANIFSDANIKGCRSEPIFRYSDVAAVRKDRQYSIYKLADLKGKKIVTYQGATTFLGTPFQEIVSDAPGAYLEMSQPMEQAFQVASGKFDVSVGDLYIFLHSIKNQGNGRYAADQFDIHHLFPDIYSHMAFTDPKLCEEFNVALRTLKKSGKYEAVYARYLKNLR